ncbi:phosphatase PAP2 family protein [Candidatus Curtissbacteria bacterium]|nr:phosphatase PAP2 family protein [Candidatus Curtissbacteria bacterium]
MANVREFTRKLFTKEELTALVYFEVAFGLFFSFISLITFLYITNAVILKQTISFDTTIENLLYSARSNWLTQVMMFLSYLGSDGMVFGAVIVALFLTLRHHRKETFIFSLLLLMGLAATTTLKLLYKIPRPEISALIVENSYSFPSGHALNSFLFYGTIAYFFYHLTQKKKASLIIAAFSAILVLLIGISRIYLGVHHPSDVLAGYLVGFWLFATTILIDKTVVFFRLVRETRKS